MLDTLSSDERVLLLAALSTTFLGLLSAAPEQAEVCRKLIGRIAGARTVVLNMPPG